MLIALQSTRTSAQGWTSPGNGITHTTDKVGIGTSTPGVSLEVIQNRAIRVGNANISSGGDFAHFGSHAWHDGTNWQFDSTAGGLYQISGQTHNWYKHNGSGSFTKLMTLDPAGYLKLGDAVTGVTPGIFAKDLAPNYSILGFYPQSGTNVNMSFQVFPKGTGQGGNVAQFSVFGTDGVADVNNIEFMTARATGTSFLLASGQGGTGILRPVILSAPPK